MDLHMEGSRVKRASKIFITQWHSARRHRFVWWRRRSVFLSPRPLVFIMYHLFPSVRLFFRCLEMSGQACVLPLPWLYKCVLMAIRRDTLCIVLGRAACQLSWMALAEVFPSASVFLGRYKCSLWGLWQPPQTVHWKQGSHQAEFFTALV